MIDSIKIRNEFKKYISNYNPENPKIKLKISHIERVANNSIEIAKKLNLSDEEIQLAEAIGIFHDIGRFEQVRIANTFSDKNSNINHAELGIKVLFENNLIRQFIEEHKYDKIIKLAVLNHNKSEIENIENKLSEKELLFSKIIRDADKLDILYSLTFEKFEDIFWYDSFNQTKINQNVINNFNQFKLIDYKNVNNNADQILIFYAYIFNLYFKPSMRIVIDNKYLDIFTKRVKENFKSENIHNQVNSILEVAKNYLNSMI